MGRGMSQRKPAEVIQSYLLAKDCNRPHLMVQAFEADAKLEMVVKTPTISFTPLSNGREAITQLLVCRFGQTYENVYTLCLGTPPLVHLHSYACRWLVAMTQKENQSVRVGCGHYQWQFAAQSGRARQLEITIESMESLDSTHQTAVLGWIASLPYPWCSAQQALSGAPQLSALDSIRTYLQS
jgi:hypothetical protein